MWWADADVAGAIGSLVTAALLAPQAALTFKFRKDPSALVGISMFTPVLVIVNNMCWLWYASLTKAWWSVAPGVVTVPMAVFTLVLLLRYRTAKPGLSGTPPS